MKIRSNRVLVHVFSGALLFCVAMTGSAKAQQETATQQWTQWGGDNGRNFSAAAIETADEIQFEELWKRDLGSGYSGIVAENDRIYTQYRVGDVEFTVCMTATTGETIWEESYDAKIPEDADASFGTGPNSTPLLSGDRLVTVGFLGDVQCRNKLDGKLIWQTSLWKDHEATPLGFGFSASPLVYEGNVILPVGGEGRTLRAFKIEDGSIAWSALDYDNSYGTPLLVNVDGMDQLILSLTDSVVAMNPKTGEQLWTFPMKNQWDTHAFVPVWNESDNVLFISSFRQSHALKLLVEEGKASFEPVWSIDKTGIGFTNAVRLGNVVYGTSGGTSSPFMTAFDLQKGEVIWKERGFGISNFLAIGDRLLLLDEKGNLAVAEPTAQKLNVVAKQRVLESEKGWTFPTVVGDVVYARNKKQIVAVRLK